MTPERRAELVAIRAAKRASRERQKAAEFMRANHHRAVFGGSHTHKTAQREAVLRALGR